MDKEELKSFLDTIYELEGLVHLAISRDDCTPELMRLIGRKANAIAEICPAAAGDNCVQEKDDSKAERYEEADMPEYSIEADPVEQPVNAVARPENIIDSPADDLEGRAAASAVAAEYVEQQPMPEPASVAEPRGRLVFSINDRYRFKRELFDNSDASFNNTLALMASMENYDEAESYFIDELQWDVKRQEVADFLEIIKKYFKE